MSVNIIHLVCKACGAEVNKIEHPHADAETRASAVAAALGVDPDQARALVAEHGVDPAADAQKLARSLANPTDSPCPTEGCPGGEVEVTA
jgi:hypothetical protein